MQKGIGIKSLALIGILVIALTLAVFFLLEIATVTVNVSALVFLLLAEVVLFGGLIGIQFSGANHSRVFLASGLTGALLLYFVSTLILTFLAGLFRERANAYILIELGVVVLFAITAIAILSFSRGIARQNEEDATKTGSIEAKRGGF